MEWMYLNSIRSLRNKIFMIGRSERGQRGSRFVLYPNEIHDLSFNSGDEIHLETFLFFV